MKQKKEYHIPVYFARTLPAKWSIVCSQGSSARWKADNQIIGSHSVFQNQFWKLAPANIIQEDLVLFIKAGSALFCFVWIGLFV